MQPIFQTVKLRPRRRQDFSRLYICPGQSWVWGIVDPLFQPEPWHLGLWGS
jgi:hypothetical protein